MKGIDLLKKIAEQQEEILGLFKVMDRNVKELMNQQINAQKISRAPSVSTTPLNEEEDKIFDFGSSPGTVRRQKTIKVFGYVQRTGGMPIPDVSVTFWNDKNEEVLKRITSVNGYWEGRLPAGKYALEYSGEKVRSINKVVELDNSMNELEIS